MIEQILEAFCRLLRILLGILTAALIIPVAMQVVARYTGIIPVYLWTEELATFIFIWMVMLGSMIAVWEGTHFDVHVVPDAKSPLGIFIQKAFVLAMISIFALLFAFYGFDYARFGYIQQSVMMQANLLLTYVTVPLAGIGWAVFALFRLWQAAQDYKNARRAMT